MSAEGNPPDKKPESPAPPAEPAGSETKPVTVEKPAPAEGAPATAGAPAVVGAPAETKPAAVPRPAAPRPAAAVKPAAAAEGALTEGAPAEGEAKPAAPKPAAAKPAAAAGAAKPAAAAAPKPKAPAPTDASDKPVVVALKAALPGAVVAATEFFGELSIEIDPAKIVETCQHMKTVEKFDYLVDLTAVDWKEKAPRFEVVYWLHSFPKNSERLRLRTRVAEGSECPSVAGVWKTANWMEREVFDMFGVRFSAHPDLRRILTWDGFQGHPLRKDFPVEGIDTGAAIYPDRFPEGGGPAPDDSNRKVVS